MEAAYQVHRLTRTPKTTFADASPRAASISLVLPAFNEEEVIEQAVEEADDALREITDDYEILVVDDGSRDATRERALHAAQGRPAVRVISHATNCGYGAALRTGFQAATKQYVGFTDADCQFDLREIDRLTVLLEDCDIACGYRIDRQDPWPRRLYSRVYNAVVRLLLGTRVRDCDCAMKLFRRETLRDLSITTDGFLINAELLTRARMAGKSVVEVGVTHRPRSRGQSTVSFLHVIPVLVALMRFWWSTVLFPGRGTQDADDVARAWGPTMHWAGAAVLALCASLLLLGNLAYPLVEPDESRYAQIALEMLQSGDFVVPRLQGEPYLDKPPLLYWVTAGSFRWFGHTEFAARLPAALAAVLTVLASFVLGSRLVGSRAAFLGASMLLMCLGFVLSGRFVIMDGLLTLFTTVCWLSMLLAVRPPRIRWVWWLVAAVACSLGILTKGPVALVLTVPPLVLLLWLDRAQARVRVRHWLAFAVGVLAVTVPWFVLIAQRQAEFVGYFLWKHHVVRFVSAFDHQQPVWYYLPVLLIGMFPSSLLLGPTLDFLFGRREELRGLRTRELGALALAAAWIVAFFSVSSCKLPTYILPAIPLLCLVQGYVLHQLLAGRYAHAAWAHLAQRLPVHATDLAVAIGAGIAVVDLALEPDQGIGQLINFGVLGGALAFLAYRLLHRRTWPARAASWGLVASVVLLVMGFAFQKFVPEFALYRSVHANAARLGQSAGGATLPVVYFAWQTDGSSLYLPADQVRRFRDGEFAGLEQFIREHPQLVIVADPPHAALLRDTLGHRISLTRSRGARGRLYLLSTRPSDATLLGTRPATPVQR